MSQIIKIGDRHYVMVDDNLQVLAEERDGVAMSTDIKDEKRDASGKWTKDSWNGDHEDNKLRDVAYFHGSDDTIDTFDPSKTKDKFVSFTDNKYHASTFGNKVHKVKLDVRNPIDLSDLGSGSDQPPDDPDDKDERTSSKDIEKALAEHGIKVDFGKREIMGFTSAILKKKAEDIIAQAKAKGYDGIFLKDYKEFEADEVMVFDSHQVKVDGIE